MDPFELLKKDHQKVSELFKQIESAAGKAKLTIFKQLQGELELHAEIEEAVFYPALEKAKETRDLTLEAYEEHKVVKDLLAELDTAGKLTDEWEAKLTVLKENVEHHVDEEENELFDKANDVLTGEEAERLGNRMQAEKVKRGGKAAAEPPAKESPGLLQTIANALGIGTSDPGANKKAVPTANKKKAAKPAKQKTATKAAAKSSGSKSNKPQSAKAAKNSTAAGKRSPAKTPRGGGKSASIKKGGAKSEAKKRSAGKKKTSRKSSSRR